MNSGGDVLTTMSSLRLVQVAGVDGCKAGWFVAIVSAVKQTGRPDASCVLTLKNSLVANTFAEVLSKTHDCELVCIDIPIGLSDGAEARGCDLAARKILGGPRASSVFAPPVRPCLSAKDPETASRICFEHSGKKLSRQSFFIMPKIREVDEAMTPRLQRRVREIHPEVSFWALNGKQPMQQNKKSLVGRTERMRLLAGIFADVRELVAGARKPKRAGPDDIIDALVTAWTASQAVMANAATLPEKPQLDSKGLRMEILYPIVPVSGTPNRAGQNQPARI